LLAAATGIVTGSGVAYLVNFFLDSIQPRGLVVPILYSSPVVALVVVALILWLRKPLSASDARAFVFYFWGSFFSFYVATTILYWFFRVFG